MRAPAGNPTPEHHRRTDVCCARRARPRDPRGRPHAHVGGVVPRLGRRQDRPRRAQRRRQDDADEGARRRPPARRRQGRALRRTRLPAAGPPFGRPGDARAHPYPRRPRARHSRPPDARGVDRDGRRRREGRREGDAPLRQPHRAVRGARRLRGRGGGGIHRAQPLAARPHPRSAAENALRWSAPAHRARAHPVLGRADDDPRRAHEPPRRRQRRVAARVPEELQGRADRHQPRR